MSITASSPPPKGIPQHVWLRMPLAKRRLLVLGPLEPGRDNFRTAVIVIAAELALHGVSEDAAGKVCSGMAFETGVTLPSKVRKSIPDWVKFAYHPPSKTPIMSGCPQTGRGNSERGTRMREAFQGYCNEGCAMTCASFKLNAMPELNLVGTDYEPVLTSALWMPAKSGGLGMEAKRLYSIIASVAVAESTNTVQASSTYLTGRVGGQIAARTIRRHMARLREYNLLRTMNKHTGLLYVTPPPMDTLTALCRTLGVTEAARWNVIDANNESLRKAEAWPTWDVEDAIEARI
jgi:hypothetical protein